MALTNTPSISKAELDVTVAIPTFNGARRFPDVLERLRLQKNLEGIRWEVLVVDNNSNDDTAETVKRCQAGWPESIPLRYAFASRPGAAFARLLAGEEARGEFLGFLDDDNLPSPEWLSNALRFAREHPKAGAVSSRIREQLTVPPPPNFDAIAVYLAMFDLGPDPVRFPDRGLLPPAAGLFVRRQAWLDCVPKDPMFRGRVKNSKNVFAYRNCGSEDIEAVAYIQNGGWEIWYCAGMEIDHKIPPSRLELEYMAEIIRGTGNGKYYIRMIRRKAWERPIYTLLFMASDLKKLVVHRWKHRSSLHSDVVAAAEQEAYMGALMSPFLHLQAKLRGEF